MNFDKSDQIEDNNQLVFDEELHRAEDGIDLDIDKVEQVIKPQAGARYTGDKQDKSFVPVGFTEPNRKDDPKPRVEFRNPGIHQKAAKQTVSFFSKVENTIFRFLKKIKF